MSVLFNQTEIPLKNDSQSNDENLGWLISSSVFLGVITVCFLIILPLLIKRKNHQPLKKKSPNLIILSTIGNMLFCFIMLLQQVLYYKCVQQGTVDEHHVLYGICQNESIANINCLIGLTLLTICEPMSIIPYFLRSFRLYVIFLAQGFYFRTKQKPTFQLRFIKEGTLIKLCLLIILILTIVTFGLYLGYEFGGNQNETIFVYTPSYNVQVCYINPSMSDQEKIDFIQTHSNVSLIYIFIWHFIECMGLLVCIHQLKSIKDDFNIRNELYIVFGVWFSASYLTTAIYLFTDNWRYLLFILIIRNFVVCMITAIKPIYQTYQNNSYIHLPPSIGCIESLDMVLIIPIASEYFYDYLEKQVEDQDAPILFSLYADLRQYERACTDDEDEQDKYEKAIAINQEYLNPQGKFYLKVHKEVKRAIDEKFINLQQNLNEFLFIELLAFVLDSLKAHFERFKRSTDFMQLEEEILRQEKLYEVLVDASIITN